MTSCQWAQRKHWGLCRTPADRHASAIFLPPTTRNDSVEAWHKACSFRGREGLNSQTKHRQWLGQHKCCMLRMPISGKEVVRRLEQLGWEVVGQRGSHVKLRKGKRGTIVPVHGNKSLKRGLLRAIEKQTDEKIL